MRVILASLFVVACAATAAAQSTLAPLPTLPPIGLPLPEISGSLTPVGLPPPTTGFERAETAPRPDPSRRGRHRAPRQPAVVYLFDSYYWTGLTGARSATPGNVAGVSTVAPTRVEGGNGTLRLDVEPDGAALQIYADGYFVGTADDLRGEITLPAGPHTIELRADGHQPLVLDTSIAAGRSITYRGALEQASAVREATTPRAPVADADPTPAPPSTFYYIPGCYMGNVPPTDVVLPPTCDRTKLITRTP